MAFERVVELSIGTDGQGLLISDLHLDFSVTRAITFEENTAEFVIYNAKETTRNEILKVGNNLIFKTGHEDEPVSTIFIGNITEAITVRDDSGNWVTTIKAASIRSSNQPLENTYVTISYSPDSRLFQPLGDIAAALGLTIFGRENADIVLDNGFTYTGSARGALNYCKKILKKNEASLYIDNTEVVIYRIGERLSRFSPVYLDNSSGLIRADDMTDYDNQSKENKKRIEFESLIISKLQPNGLVTIKTDKVDGTFTIQKIVFQGNNYGGDNRCMGEAVE